MPRVEMIHVMMYPQEVGGIIQIIHSQRTWSFLVESKYTIYDAEMV